MFRKQILESFSSFPEAIKMVSLNVMTSLALGNDLDFGVETYCMYFILEKISY